MRADRQQQLRDVLLLQQELGIERSDSKEDKVILKSKKKHQSRKQRHYNKRRTYEYASNGTSSNGRSNRHRIVTSKQPASCRTNVIMYTRYLIAALTGAIMMRIGTTVFHELNKYDEQSKHIEESIKEFDKGRQERREQLNQLRQYSNRLNGRAMGPGAVDIRHFETDHVLNDIGKKLNNAKNNNNNKQPENPTQQQRNVVEEVVEEAIIAEEFNIVLEDRDANDNKDATDEEDMSDDVDNDDAGNVGNNNSVAGDINNVDLNDIDEVNYDNNVEDNNDAEETNGADDGNNNGVQDNNNVGDNNDFDDNNDGNNGVQDNNDVDDNNEIDDNNDIDDNEVGDKNEVDDNNEVEDKSDNNEGNDNDGVEDDKEDEDDKDAEANEGLEDNNNAEDSNDVEDSNNFEDNIVAEAAEIDSLSNDNNEQEEEEYQVDSIPVTTTDTTTTANVKKHPLLPDKVFTIVGLENSATMFMAKQLEHVLGIVPTQHNHYNHSETIVHGISSSTSYKSNYKQEYITEIQHVTLPWGGGCTHHQNKTKTMPVIYPSICMNALKESGLFVKATKTSTIDKNSQEWKQCFELMDALALWEGGEDIQVKDAIAAKARLNFPSRYLLNLTSHYEWYRQRGVQIHVIMIARDKTVAKKATMQKYQKQCNINASDIRHTSMIQEEQKVADRMLRETIHKYIGKAPLKTQQPEQLSNNNSTTTDTTNLRRRLQSTTSFDNSDNNNSTTTAVGSSKMVLLSYEMLYRFQDIYLKLIYDELGIIPSNKDAPVHLKATLNNANTSNYLDDMAVNALKRKKGRHRADFLGRGGFHRYRDFGGDLEQRRRKRREESQLLQKASQANYAGASGGDAAASGGAERYGDGGGQGMKGREEWIEFLRARHEERQRLREEGRNTREQKLKQVVNKLREQDSLNVNNNNNINRDNMLINKDYSHNNNHDNRNNVVKDRIEMLKQIRGNNAKMRDHDYAAKFEKLEKLQQLKRLQALRYGK